MAPQDFRKDPMDSVEGRGRARARYDAFHDKVPEETWQLVYEVRGRAAGVNDVPKAVGDDLANKAIEDSALLGFWLAWHLAGGFANLEAGGWHRATIHRHVRAFRERYHAHPDELSLTWLELDLEQYWLEKLWTGTRLDPDFEHHQDEDEP